MDYLPAVETQVLIRILPMAVVQVGKIVLHILHMEVPVVVELPPTPEMPETVGLMVEMEVVDMIALPFLEV